MTAAGMTTAAVYEIVRQRDVELKEAVWTSLAGEVMTAFEKLGDRVSQAEPEHLSRDAGVVRSHRRTEAERCCGPA